MARLSAEESGKIIQAYLDAHAAGDLDEAHRIMKLLPLAPELALLGKELYGAESMKNSGYDLSLADKKYGDGWLDG